MKPALRERMLARRAAIAPEDLLRAGDRVTERVLCLPELDGAVFCYLSVRDELPTRALVDALRARGLAVAVPRVARSGMEARLYQEPLVTGVLGIPTSEGPLASGLRVALCPGLAFDPSGARLGYGKGYYDRWLAAHPDVLPIGLCLDEALVDAVPTDTHDRRMAMIVTPSGLIRCAS